MSCPTKLVRHSATRSLPSGSEFRQALRRDSITRPKSSKPLLSAFSAISIVLTRFWLKETHGPDKRGTDQARLAFSLDALFKALRHPAVGLLLLLMFTQQIAFGGFEQILSLFTLNRLGMNASANAILFVFVGVIVVVVQGGMIGRWSRKWGDRKLVYIGLAMLALGMALTALTPAQTLPGYSKAQLTAELTRPNTLRAHEAPTTQDLPIAIPEDGNSGWGGLLWLLVAMIPTGIAGLTCKGLVEASGRWLWLVGVFYLYNAILLFLADRARASVGPDTAGPATRDELCGVTLRQALTVGLLQVLALLPGVSRSGSTVAGGLFTGMRPGLAVGFSFLVGGPLIAAAAAKDALGGGFGALHHACGAVPLLVACGVAFVSGLGAVWLLKLVTARRMLGWFALYCLLIALACLAGQFLAPAPEC